MFSLLGLLVAFVFLPVSFPFSHFPFATCEFPSLFFMPTFPTAQPLYPNPHWWMHYSP
jgi:hypothetical protein